MPKLDLLFYFSLSTNGVTKSPRIYLVLLSPFFFQYFDFYCKIPPGHICERKKKGGKVEPTHLEMQMKNFWTLTLLFDVKYMNYFKRGLINFLTFNTLVWCSPIFL